MELIKRRKKSKKTAIFFIFIIGLMTGLPIGLMIGSPTGQSVTLDMVYSSEKRAWIEDIVIDFKEWYKKETGQIVQVNFRALGSRKMVISVLTGEIKPTILSPASSIWIPFLNSRWNKIQNKDIINADNQLEVITPVYSPIVIGTWKNFNKS